MVGFLEGMPYREGHGDNFGYTSGTITTSDGVPFTTCFQRWNSKTQVPRQPDWSVAQDLTGLPDGKYRLKAYILTNVTGMQPEGRFLVAKTLAGEKRTEAICAVAGREVPMLFLIPVDFLCYWWYGHDRHDSGKLQL